MTRGGLVVRDGTGGETPPDVPHVHGNPYQSGWENVYRVPPFKTKKAAEARAREYQGAPDAKGRFVFGVNRSDNGRWTVVRRPDVGTVRRD